MHLETDYLQKQLLAKTGGRFLITGANCPLQTGHNDFERPERNNPVYFITVNGSKQCTLWSTRGSRNYVFYSDEEREILRNVIHMEEVILPAESVFFEAGYLQHAGGGWKVKHALRHHMYVIPKDVDLKVTVSLAYGGSLKRNVDAKRELLLGNRDPGGLPEEKGSDDAKGSNKSNHPEEEVDHWDSIVEGWVDLYRNMEVPQE